MKRRCEDPNCDRYPRWGGRGIKVCPAWHDFSVFFGWAIEAGYAPGLSIDRIDNDGDYRPGNCRWATRSEQSANRRNRREITAFGETKSVTEWSRDPRCKVTHAALYLRVSRRGWDAERALTVPEIKNNGDAEMCPSGHAYSEGNIYWTGPDRTWRRCRICTLAGQKARHAAKRKGAAQAG